MPHAYNNRSTLSFNCRGQLASSYICEISREKFFPNCQDCIAELKQNPVKYLNPDRTVSSAATLTHRRCVGFPNGTDAVMVLRCVACDPPGRGMQVRESKIAAPWGKAIDGSQHGLKAVSSSRYRNPDSVALCLHLVLKRPDRLDDVAVRQSRPLGIALRSGLGFPHRLFNRRNRFQVAGDARC